MENQCPSQIKDAANFLNKNKLAARAFSTSMQILAYGAAVAAVFLAIAMGATIGVYVIKHYFKDGPIETITSDI